MLLMIKSADRRDSFTGLLILFLGICMFLRIRPCGRLGYNFPRTVN
jgi:hypothetical protein